MANLKFKLKIQLQMRDRFDLQLEINTNCKPANCCLIAKGLYKFYVCDLEQTSSD